jgi:hypothetical protein
LECLYLGNSRWRGGLVDRQSLFEITTDVSNEQLGKLLRASRTLYTRERESEMIQKALKCGCAVRFLDRQGKVLAGATDVEWPFNRMHKAG